MVFERTAWTLTGPRALLIYQQKKKSTKIEGKYLMHSLF